MSGPDPNTLYYGDCLDWMEQWDDESVDLIYLDPPFNSNANYNILYSSEGGGDAQFRVFPDTWSWDEAAADRLAMFENATGRPAHGVIVGLHQILGRCGMLAYLTYMAERLEHMHRLLKQTGSIYLHCDPTASHGLKLVMDKIFGHSNFRREIIWDIAVLSGFKTAAKNWIRGHDTVLYYQKGSHAIFNKQRQKHRKEYLDRFNKTDEDGRRYFDGRGSRRYLDEVVAKGKAIGDVWSDIMSFQQIPTAKEHLGYPTQKPMALLNRIIKASSNEGDIVLDPFCGCGTAIDAANRLNRQWVGIDISSFAIDLICNERLQNKHIPTKGIPYDLASARKLASEHPFSFESWAVTRLPGFAPNTKQIADGGVDGRATLSTKPDNHDSRLALAQIKGGKFSLSALRDFIGVTNRDRAALGCYVTLEPVDTPQARSEAAHTGKIRVSGREYRRMNLWPISHYFEQRLPELPVMNDPYSGKPLKQYGLF